MYDTWGLVAKKPKGHWRLFPKHTKSNCAAVGLEESQVLHTIPLLYWVFFLLVILDTPNIILSAETRFF